MGMAGGDSRNSRPRGRSLKSRVWECGTYSVQYFFDASFVGRKGHELLLRGGLHRQTYCTVKILRLVSFGA